MINTNNRVIYLSVDSHGNYLCLSAKAKRFDEMYELFLWRKNTGINLIIYDEPNIAQAERHLEEIKRQRHSAQELQKARDRDRNFIKTVAVSQFQRLFNLPYFEHVSLKFLGGIVL